MAAISWPGDCQPGPQSLVGWYRISWGSHMAKNPWLQLRTEFFFAIHPKTPTDLFLRILFDFCCCFPMEKWLESWLGPGVQFYRLQQTQCQHYGAGFVMTWRRAGADGASEWDQKKMALASSWWMKSVELKHWTIPHVTMISEWTVQVTSQLYRLCGGCGVVKNKPVLPEMNGWTHPHSRFIVGFTTLEFIFGFVYWLIIFS